MINDSENDTTKGISDHDIALALSEKYLLASAAEFLGRKHGRTIDQYDLAERIHKSPFLQLVRALAKGLFDQEMDRTVRAALAKRRQVVEARNRRNRGPRCGAETRKRTPCQRKVVLGRNRCPNHGGLSTGPKTPEGKARAAQGLRQRWKRK